MTSSPTLRLLWRARRLTLTTALRHEHEDDQQDRRAKISRLPRPAPCVMSQFLVSGCVCVAGCDRPGPGRRRRGRRSRVARASLGGRHHDDQRAPSGRGPVRDAIVTFGSPAETPVTLSQRQGGLPVPATGEGGVRPRCSHASGAAARPARRAGHEALADQERLGDGLDGLGLLADGHRQRATARPARRRTGGTARRARRGRAGPGRARRRRRAPARTRAASWSTTPAAVHLGPVAHPAQQPVGDAGCAARPPGDLGDAGVVGVDARAGRPSGAGSVTRSSAA